MFILVNGTTATGYNDTTGDSPLWLPIIPMAWDNGADPVLSVVGTALLAVLPMQVWCTTFKDSEAKTVLFLWSWTALRRDRFRAYQLVLPTNFNETIAFTNPGQNSFTLPTGQIDEYY